MGTTCNFYLLESLFFLCLKIFLIFKLKIKKKLFLHFLSQIQEQRDIDVIQITFLSGLYTGTK